MNKDLMFPVMYGTGNPINLRKLGRHRKRAVLAITYGASTNTVVRVTGLSRRVARVLQKQIFGPRKVKMTSSHQIIHGGRSSGKSKQVKAVLKVLDDVSKEYQPTPYTGSVIEHLTELWEEEKERGIEIKPNRGGSC